MESKNILEFDIHKLYANANANTNAKAYGKYII